MYNCYSSLRICKLLSALGVFFLFGCSGNYVSGSEEYNYIAKDHFVICAGWKSKEDDIDLAAKEECLKQNISYDATFVTRVNFSNCSLLYPKGYKYECSLSQ